MGAALGNQYALGNEGGRPLRYKSVDDLACEIDDYFNTITITKPVFDSVVIGKDDDGNDLFDKVPRLNNAGRQVMVTDYLEIPSILGMCRHLGVSRKVLLDYECRDEFSEPLKKAKERVEQYLEEQLLRTTQVAGVIFNLKNNYGWKDIQTVEQTGPNGGPLLINQVATLSDADLTKMIEIMERAQLPSPEIVDIEPDN